jgi:hypothetical protein
MKTKIVFEKTKDCIKVYSDTLDLIFGTKRFVYIGKIKFVKRLDEYHFFPSSFLMSLSHETIFELNIKILELKKKYLKNEKKRIN